MPQKPSVIHNTIRKSVGERIFNLCNVLFFFLLGLCMILPFWNVVAISFTTNGEFMNKPFILWPENPTFQAYQYIFATPLIPRAYGVTLLITVCGMTLSTLVVSMMAYGLSKDHLRGHRFFIVFLLITMFFHGGMIPTYFTVKNTLKLYNTYWAMFLPSTVSVFNFIIVRSFFRQLPAALEESAKIDGANDITILFRIIYPLSIPTLATIALFVAVGLWNSWFSANLYISDAKMYPLQLVIRNFIYKANKPAEMDMYQGMRDASGRILTLNEEGVKMACVTVSIVPLLLIYPFVQKYFEKGVTIGAVKG